MSRNIMTVTKWLPLESEEHKNLFLQCKQLDKTSQVLFIKLGSFLNHFQVKNAFKTVTTSELPFQQMEIIVEDMCNLTESFTKAFEKLHCDNLPLTQPKMKMWKNILWKIKLKLSYLLQEIVNEVAYLYIYYGENILILTMKLLTMYNKCLSMDTKFNITKKMSITSNTCPYLMYPMRKISVTKLLQILSQNRAELCTHKLIDCLLETYKLHDNHDEDNSSDNSSLEIYRAITKHMSPPVEVIEQSPKTDKANASDIDDSSSFVNMEELLNYEEQNVLDLLAVALKEAPTLLGNDGVKKSRNGETKISTKARNKVLDYYQEILWGEVGNYLEHIILWWGASPLSARPPHSSQHLREWINQFVPTADVPAPILSALSNLADALGVHVTLTSWDQHFRLVLVASNNTYNNTMGKLFSDMFHDLVLLCNQFEVTTDWVVGAPLDELPLVEQIPVLHRLDHSIHTTRLWAVSETKKIANNWNVDSFFMITHSDIVNCLSQLSDLRLTDHTNEIEKGGLGVHVEVCANMRAKLVSEVKTNMQKLKESPHECVECLASVCRTISLANLQMIFPESEYWKQTLYEVPDKPCAYVEKYLHQILMPVLAATEDYHISNMILKLMCESWLDHIYINKIKFSQFGACQLLCDFASVSAWIVNCPIITQEMRRKMLKNEVLRRCEGVGRLLLRSPGEHIKMSDKNKKIESEHSPKSDKTELMPAEMYVPNQEQWLELRASRKKVFLTSLCCSNTTI